MKLFHGDWKLWRMTRISLIMVPAAIALWLWAPSWWGMENGPLENLQVAVLLWGGISFMGNFEEGRDGSGETYMAVRDCDFSDCSGQRSQLGTVFLSHRTGAVHLIGPALVRPNCLSASGSSSAVGFMESGLLSF